jgi:two-component system NtrC family sensor kinase
MDKDVLVTEAVNSYVPSRDEERARTDANPMIRMLLRSFWILPVVMAAVLILSIAIIAVASGRSLERFETVHGHAAQLQRLRRAEERLTRILSHPESARARDFEDARAGLDAILARGGYLDPDTSVRLRESSRLLAEGASASSSLEAVSKIEEALAGEMTAHDDLLARVERDTRVELMLSTALTVTLPFAGGFLLYALRRRLLRPLDRLRELMSLLSRQEYRTVSTTELDPLIQPVFQNYNYMATRLSELEQQHLSRQRTLEDEVRSATGALLQQQHELARSERLAALGELAAGVAHELRNPLAGIQIALSAMSKELAEEEQSSRLDLVVEELKRVTRLLNQLLEAARPTPEPARPVVLKSLVREFVSLARYQIPARVELREEIPAGLVCHLPDGGLRQALWNLVLNSCEAIGDREGEITLDAECEHGRLRLRVLDDGPGFPPELLESGVRTFATLRPGGSGLGLATVRRFAHDLGGELRIENVTPHGASVVLELPCKEGHG